MAVMSVTKLENNKKIAGYKQSNDKIQLSGQYIYSEDTTKQYL